MSRADREVAARAPGALALVLHTHMPYVEGFGTWPFGEEWVFEAMATCYLPLLDVLEAGAPVTLSLTPVLCDQLEAPGLAERFAAFLGDLRVLSHRLDVEDARAADDTAAAAELERAAGQYVRALEAFEARGRDLLGALAPYARWTSAATHAVLPLLATDAGARLQVHTGIAAHRARFDGWAGGFWLPECAHASWVDAVLAEAGVAAACVDLTTVFGFGAPEHLRPLRSEPGPLLVPIDREIVELVWSPAGYPSAPAYRDRHNRTEHHHRPWANDGAVYDPARAAAQVRADAADFVSRARARVERGGLCVCALDTELLGDWWHEGCDWLAAVVGEADAQGLELVCIDDALTETPAAPAPELPVTSWGRDRDLSTWDGPQVADLVWHARRAELDVLAAGPGVPERAVRELLALQASDWAFQVTEASAGPYPRERAEGHRRALEAALAGSERDPAVRHLAPYLELRSLLAP